MRDYKNFNKDNFCNLLSNIDWESFDTQINLVVQCNFLYAQVLEILAIMCPFKQVHTRYPRKKWMTPRIYSLIRERKCLIRNYRKTKNPDLMGEIRSIRNQVNATIDRAKIYYVKTLLESSRKDPKRFWRNIKSVLENENENNQNFMFKDPDSGIDIPKDGACNYINDYFATIADRICKPEDSLPFIPGLRVGTTFEFMPPERCDIMIFAENIDTNSSSGVTGLNSSICKIIMLHIPEKMCMIFANSMFTGIFPPSWAISTVKLLPKIGDLSNPGNWRPISMTNVFSKILEKFIGSY